MPIELACHGRLFLTPPHSHIPLIAWRAEYLYLARSNSIESTMSDYFGVNLPPPLDEEYVDPASARTIAKLLHEDVTGKCVDIESLWNWRALRY